MRLNRMSFEIGNAVMHTTGQAFPMAFQAGGPHAQDRGLEAVATAWAEMTRSPATAIWEKPQGKAAPIVLEKHWRVVPRGVALIIGCQTFPTWNSYPGLFASLATGNPVIVKPHPGAILPLALTVAVIRDVLAEQGLPRDVVLLAADAAGRRGDAGPSAASGGRDHRLYRLERLRRLGAGERWRGAGLHRGGRGQLDRHRCDRRLRRHVREHRLLARALQRTDVHRAAGHLRPRRWDRRRTTATSRSRRWQRASPPRSMRCSPIPARASGVCGAIANPATLERIEAARGLGRIVRDSAPLAEGRSATPLIVAVDAADTAAYEEERFGPISFVVAVSDADEGIARAADLARRKGAITAALYDTDEDRIMRAADAFARAGVNLSINLTGNIFVNQSAAFSDYHVTGANPAGNASLTDAAFVANRFARVMWRRPKAA